MTSSSSYRPDVDGLRALAVLSVLLFHFGWPGFSGGFLGVDVFFVISGFLITRLIVEEIDETGSLDFQRFYMRRVRRLFPALAVVCAVSGMAAFTLLSPSHFRFFGQELIVAILSVSNIFYFFESDYFGISKNFQALLHTWSLGVEAQFYLVLPVLMLLSIRCDKWKLALSAGLAVVASLLSAEAISSREAAFFLTPFRIFEFAAGAALVWLVPYRLPAPLRELALAGGLLLIVVPIHFYSDSTHLPGILSLLPVFGAMLCIHSGEAPRIGRVLRNPVAVGLGRISYSLYLVHWPLFVFYAYIVPSLTAVDRIALVTASIVSAVLLYVLVERPLRYPSRRDSGGNRTFLRTTAFAVVGCLVLGAAISLGKGWVWRVPDEVYSLLASAKRETVLANPCHYDSDQADEAFERRFHQCVATSGTAVLVVGDSHAGDLFPALAGNSLRPHIASVWQGGCRPAGSRADCHYESVIDFVSRNNSSIAAIIFKQKGGYFLGQDMSLPVREDVISETLDYLELLEVSRIPVIWAGPQWEPFFEVDKARAFRPISSGNNYLQEENPHIDEVDQEIQDAISQRHASIRYVSLVDILGPLTLEDYLVDGEFTYSDTDHWSAKGEEVFGAQLLADSLLLRHFLMLEPPGT